MISLTQLRVTGRGKKATDLMGMVRLIDIKGGSTEMSISRKAGDIIDDQTNLQDTMIAVTVNLLGVLATMTRVVPNLLTQVTTHRTSVTVKVGI
jgi:hypothetical protein